MIRALLSLTLLLATAAGGAAASLSVPESDGPLPVTVLVYFVDLDSVDSARQTFTANVFIRLDWIDLRLAHEDEGPLVKTMDEIWHPYIQILNQQKLWKTFPERLEVFSDGRVTYRK